MAQSNAYNRPSASTESHPWIENTVFDLWLVETSDARPADKEG